jgi:hypothetical protein
MPLTDKNYYIIHTPPIIAAAANGSVTTNITDKISGKPHTVTITSNQINLSTIYYSDIITSTTLVTSYGTAPISGTYTIPNAGSSIYQLSKEISDRLMSFINDVQLFKECLDTTKKGTPRCTDVFDTTTITSESIFPLYNTTVQVNRNQVMSDVNFPYRNKHLLQQSYDLTNLINTFNTILGNISRQSDLPDDNYASIKTMYDNNLKLRNELDQKLGEIYKYKDSRIMQSQYNLDRIVYTNVILTILATSMIYIVFSKL